MVTCMPVAMQPGAQLPAAHATVTKPHGRARVRAIMIEVMRALLLLALSSCQLVFSAETPSSDATSCVNGTFGSPIGVNGIDIQVSPVTNPSLNGDQLWFTSEGPVRQIMSSVRQPDGSYSAPMSAKLTSGDELDVGMSGDGLRLVFLRDLDNVRRVEEVVRGTRSEPFENLQRLNGLPDDIGGIDLSFDGLAVYYSNAIQNMFVARRSALGLEFEAPEQLVESGGPFGGEFPSISPDELELFYACGIDICRRVRPAIDAPFGPLQILPEDGRDPDLSADARTLVYVRRPDDQVRRLERECD